MNHIKSAKTCAAMVAAGFLISCTAPGSAGGSAAADAGRAGPASGTVVDVDGNVYRTVTIGRQTWMAENLRVTKDPAGDPIVSYCYNDDPADCETHGRLYTWEVAMNGATAEGARGICPDGWHIPSDAEWVELFEYLGGEDAAGEKLSIDGSTGFDALLEGGADFRGNYLYRGEYSMFWSSTEVGEERAYHHSVDSDGKASKFAAMKGARIAIRAIKD
ncbi:MAG: hypothetical protein JSV91_09950 [Phycisphaerales bacterium]|nr:MAG: hypothetical protein JSV91_09950 [Phycisphaerales bacterium]